MKRKLIFIGYTAVILAGCFLMSAAMFLQGGVALAEAVQQGEDTGENPAQKIEQYMSMHFGGRQELIQAYGMIQHQFFDHSPVEDVVAGTDGYLYYKDTVDDYCGIGTVDDRELFNIYHTLELMQEAVEQKGAEFVFLAAPNKNSLYDHMPYYYIKYQEKNNLDLLKEHLDGVDHIDLFPVFENRNEELYYKTDTHWNDLGAWYVYEEVMRTLGKEYDDLQRYGYEEEYTFTGDLQRMLYPLSKDNELQITFGKEAAYTFLTRTRNFEQAYIETENDSAEGSLLMFRDSFANNLIPYFSDAYQYAVYDKSVPYDLAKMETYQADTVILEIAERNVKLIQEYEPRFPAPEREMLRGKPRSGLVQEWDIADDGDMVKITGTINPSYAEADSRIYIRTADAVYEMTPQKIGGCEYGFCGYAAIQDAGSVDVIAASETGVWEQKMEN